MKKYTLKNNRKWMLYFAIYLVVGLLKFTFELFTIDRPTYILVIQILIMILEIYVWCHCYINLAVFTDTRLTKGLFFRRTILFENLKEVVIEDDYIRLVDIKNRKINIMKNQNKKFFSEFITHIIRMVSNEKLMIKSQDRPQRLQGLLKLVILYSIFLVFSYLSTIVVGIKNIFENGIDLNSILIPLGILGLILAFYFSVKLIEMKKSVVSFAKPFLWYCFVFAFIQECLGFYMNGDFLIWYKYILLILTLLGSLFAILIYLEYFKSSIRVRETLIR